MDSSEATEIVFSRIQGVDPENASKITGYLLIQEHGEKEIIRLAFCPETLLHSVILEAKIQLGIISPFMIPWRPCLYFSRGFRRNGNTCRFFHGGDYNGKGVDLGTRCVEVAERLQRLRGWCWEERKEIYGMKCSVASRQIYLTFPADTSFREEDVANYFSIYGPVHDVRIPYKEKRMFGFVTFMFSETVRLVLAKGNPHFVCDSRVLVKPYKEKGRTTDKNKLIPTIDTLLPSPPHLSQMEEKSTPHHVFGRQFRNGPHTDGGEDAIRHHFCRRNVPPFDKKNLGE